MLKGILQKKGKTRIANFARTQYPNVLYSIGIPFSNLPSSTLNRKSETQINTNVFSQEAFIFRVKIDTVTKLFNSGQLYLNMVALSAPGWYKQ